MELDREAQRAKAKDIMLLVNKTLKTDAIRMANDEKFVTKYMPTGVLPIDILLRGGIARGRVTTLYGDFSSAKSLVIYYAIAQCQKDGGIAALIETEHTFDSEWAESLGVDTKALMLIQKDQSGEKGLDQAAALLATKQIDLLAIDSLTALVPTADYGQALEDTAQPGRHAAMMSRGLRKIVTSNDNTALLFATQVRQNIGMAFGPKENVSGGKALGFYSSVMVQMRKVGVVDEAAKSHDGTKWVNYAKLVTGQKFKAELNKSKLNKPYAEVYFTWNLNNAEIDIPLFCISQGLELGIIKQAGAWYNFTAIDENGEEVKTYKGQGLENFASELQEDGGVQHLINMVAKHYELRNIYSV